MARLEDKIRVMSDPRYLLIKCGCIVCLIPVAALLIWLSASFVFYEPSCYIQGFYVPALNLIESSNITTRNPHIFFDLAIKNIMKDRGVRYDRINLTLFYNNPNGSSRLPVGNYAFPGFYQGNGKIAQRRDVVETHGVPWEEAFSTISNGSTTVFRLDLATKTRSKYWFLYSRRRGMKVGANIEVNNSGRKAEKKAIPLKSGASKPKALGLFVLFAMLIHFYL